MERMKRSVYVWELPVRVFHWVNALCIVVLFATGLYIGNPFVVPAVSEEAHFFFLMGWARYIHFIAAFLFTANLLMRAYWFLKGNRYARTNPLRSAFWRGLVETLKSYLFLKNRKPHYIGHNPLAELSYLIFIGLGSVIMVLTGFVLYFEPQWESAAGGLFSRVAALFGGDSFSVRSWHHLVAWGFALFVPIHVYMAFREDWLSRNATISSIFTGYKYEAARKERGDEERGGGEGGAGDPAGGSAERRHGAGDRKHPVFR